MRHRRKAGKAQNHEYWQTFADIAMGLMAMLTLILFFVLNMQVEEKKAIERQLNDLQLREQALKKEKQELIETSGRFAADLQRVLQTTLDFVRHQNTAEELIRSVFDGDCRLSLATDGTLTTRTTDGATDAAELYRGGAFGMSPYGREALASCRNSFARLAHCLSWEVTEDPDSRKAKLEACLASTGANENEREAARQLSVGIEALVLSGSTDSNPYLDPETKKPHNPIYGLKHDRRYSMSAMSFFSNAYLGAERARQAMGTLLLQIQDMAADDYDVLPVLMSRLRVETSSFGRFQVGPRAWRDTACNDSEADEAGICDAARRLSLNVRWKKEELRRPITSLQSSFCELLSDPASTFSVNLQNSGKSLEDARQELGCISVTQDEAE